MWTYIASVSVKDNECVPVSSVAKPTWSVPPLVEPTWIHWSTLDHNFHRMRLPDIDEATGDLLHATRTPTDWWAAQHQHVIGDHGGGAAGGA